MAVVISDAAFDPWSEVNTYQQQSSLHGRYGATSVFVGTMRDFNAGENVTSMVLEHYPGMTEKYITGISLQARSRWDLLDSLIMHRTGKIVPNEPIVLVAVWAAHRKEAFEASRYLMEALKSNAPFWKKEQLDTGSRWVQQNTPG